MFRKRFLEIFFFTSAFHFGANFENLFWIYKFQIFSKLDGVGPVDNRPSTDKFHHFVRKKNKNKIKL